MKVLYFAWMREKIGRGEEVLDPVPDGAATVAGLMDILAARGGGYAEAFADRKVVRTAVNQTYAGPDQAIAAGDEVAFFPPVTGG